ncbi:DUF6922 domain-containing protein [Mucilaginibacter aquaedulcis]|uniref:DUF6922 domain-containing protein n=1 Tax=Mucilaginibacter aquaedulcis TaxID=1187081 RepID=UPI0025B5CB98|nr:hypothetical protein [Mucilaginibacter aquaedulcis]MDN3550517.1 hypothetical protein [Mucilaginibacter aquaedulcis]
MIKEINKRVVLVQWKRFAGIDIDVFSSLKGFCDSYPDFNYHTLNNYLSKKKIPFENDEVKIERQPLIQKISRPSLSPVLFWDFEFEKIDWRRSRLTIIERVLNKGDQSDWKEIIRFYGQDNLIHALKEEINYLTDMTVEAVCEYFQLSKTELKCYTKKQLNQGHWI